MIRSLIILFLSLVIASCSSELIKSEEGFEFDNDSIHYRVEFYFPGTVRILSMPQGSTLNTKRLVVDESLSRYTKVKTLESKNGFKFMTNVLEVRFDKEKNTFSFWEVKTAKLLLQEKSDKPARTFKKSFIGGESCYRVTRSFIPTPGEALYGLGQYQNGIMNYRGHSIQLLQANMDIVNPFLVSTNRYGILWDNYSSTTFEDNDEGYTFSSEVGDASDYYFVYGQDMDAVIGGYRKLTGKAPMFAKWAYGFWQSKERYKSFEEVEQVVSEYRQREIPLDNIVQDWEYWGSKSHWNSMEFDSVTFPNAGAEIKNLQDKYHVNYMISVWPGFGAETKIYEDLKKAGALFDEPTWAGYKVFDVYNPQARQIFWEYLKRGLYNKGVDAWWLDATEPSFRDGFTQKKQEERTKSAGNTYLGAFHRYLNTYSLELTKFLYPKLRGESNEKRVFILTRSAFASQQRYAAAVWSGDVPASWESMRRQISAGINLSMSGIPYWTSDIGGFFVTEREGKYPKGLLDESYKELYTRWFQFGTFSPIFRAHGTNVPREIWQFGEPGTPFYDTQLKFIQLRYRLMPYIYSYAEKISSEGYTLMRGLAMDFTDDVKTYDIDNAYMFGSAFLVRPVLQSSSMTDKTITYLPTHSGKFWYNFWSNNAVECGRADTISSPIDIMPLYVKAGSIIPLADVKQYALEYPDKNLEIRVYTGEDASFLWYDDDGDGYDYESGAFSKVQIDWNNTEKRLTFSTREGRYSNMPDTVNLAIKIISPGEPIIQKEQKYTGEQIVLNFNNH
ncbi:MAG: DUF5110 domain-containing protein [Porphyromonadaceae bacterium]|nr:DUF5110 domain-containing protein [Porphyromonadaceae bacterium]